MLGLISWTVTTSYGPPGSAVVATRTYINTPDRGEVIPASGGPAAPTFYLGTVGYWPDPNQPGRYYRTADQGPGPNGLIASYTGIFRLLSLARTVSVHGTTYLVTGFRSPNPLSRLDWVAATVVDGRIVAIRMHYSSESRSYDAEYKYSSFDATPLIQLPSPDVINPAPFSGPCPPGQVPVPATPNGAPPQPSCQSTVPRALQMNGSK